MAEDRRLQYEKTMDDIEEYIDLHGLRENEPLPAERMLAEILQVSRGTVREAIDQMCKEQRLYTIHGKGSFVAPAKEVIDMQQMISFSGAALVQKQRPGSKFISFSRERADSTVAHQLDLDKDEEIYKLVRVRLLNGKRINMEQSHIPCKYCEYLERHVEGMESLYSLLEEEYGIHMLRQDVEVSLSKASKIEANLLDMDYLEPVFVENAVAVDQQERKIEYTKSIINTNNAKYTVLLNA